MHWHTTERERDRQTDRQTETETDRDRERKYNKNPSISWFENDYSKFWPIVGLFSRLARSAKLIPILHLNLTKIDGIKKKKCMHRERLQLYTGCYRPNLKQNEALIKCLCRINKRREVISEDNSSACRQGALLQY